MSAESGVGAEAGVGADGGVGRPPAPDGGALPAAVLFDMDGTLVDTECLWWDAAAEVAAGLGHRLGDTDAPEVVGRAVLDTAAHLVRVTAGDGAAADPPAAASGTARPAAGRAAGPPRASADAVDTVARQLTRAFLLRVEAGAPLRPGVRSLLAALRAADVPFALVSASPRSVVDSVVAGALDGAGFAFTLSADDTARTKPHPAPYLAAAGRLGVAPGACVVVEDSPDGTASARAAGCPVLVVPSLLPVAEGEGRYFAASLDGVGPADLAACVSVEFRPRTA
ncbi:HAD family phosphatase [Streptomyces sp. NPDC047002]|uniref:HAD family hydrolase n=1 Tax=Streptomyces sp. NPDC047002 TaxID=3155475 RepID=UPI00345245A7